MVQLSAKVTDLPKIGKAISAKLKKIGIETVLDLIFYYPFRYEDYSRQAKISDARPGETLTVRGRIEMIAGRRSRFKRKHLTEAILSDDSGSVKAIWFNQPWIAKSLKIGDEIFLSGKVAGDLFDVHFVSPIYERVGSIADSASRLIPVYPSTEGVTQKQLRQLIKIAVQYASEVPDWLPQEIAKSEKLLSLPDSLRQIHFPKDPGKLKKPQNVWHSKKCS